MMGGKFALLNRIELKCAQKIFNAFRTSCERFSRLHSKMQRFAIRKQEMCVSQIYKFFKADSLCIPMFSKKKCSTIQCCNPCMLHPNQFVFHLRLNNAKLCEDLQNCLIQIWFCFQLRKCYIRIFNVVNQSNTRLNRELNRKAGKTNQFEQKIHFYLTPT